jgi:hypothetical protein
MTGTTYPTSTPTGGLCTTVPAAAASWYCQAISTAANYGYSRSATVKVEPVIASCPGTITSQCYKVSVTKYVPIYLVGALGYHGNQTVAGTNYQTVTASALAAAPGPPVDFCILTTNGDMTTHGSPAADLHKCSTFSNGATRCTGGGVDSGYDYATGTANCDNGVNVSSQPADCDPYGATTQTIQGNSVSCPTSTNASGNIPNAPAGCTTATANNLAVNSSSFPKANVITQASVNGTASGGYPNATSMTIGGQSMQVIQVCGNASFGGGISGAGSTGSVSACGSTVTYTGTNSTTANLVIIVYDGALSLNGCTFQNSEPSTGTAGGVTVALAPITATAGSSCTATSCTISSANSTGGELDIAAPKAGTFSGLAIMQSADYSATAGCNPSGSHAGPLDWCDAGNTPSLALQGLLYWPNGSVSFSGAIAKFDQPGALNCISMVVHDLLINGTGYVIDNTGAASITGGCSTAGVTLPTVPHTHTFYQALVG